MKKMKVVLSRLLALIMLVTMMSCLQLVSAASLKDVGIQLDDNAYTATASGTNAYTVKIPDGRPRIPQISCEGATVTQAFMADNMKEATATIVKGATTYTVTFVKDASLGFVLQYDDHYTWNPGLSGSVTYSSSAVNIATVDSKGEIVVKKVDNKGVTITATNGSQTKQLVITKTIKAVLGVWGFTGQSNASFHYNDTSKCIVPAKGTSYFIGESISPRAESITPMVNNAGKANTGGNESAIAKAVYDKTGEKVLVLSSGISGAGIDWFLPGQVNSSGLADSPWLLTNHVYEAASSEWNSASFQANYEVRMRSFFFLQGCAESGRVWTYHYNGFAVNKNKVAFTTNGVNYPAGTHTFFSYMTEVLGYDACLNIMVAWRPIGIITSTRTAQFKLEKDFDNYVNITRAAQTMSEAEGSYRGDRLHMNQIGKNRVGSLAGANAARYYTGELREAATGAYAYFNKIQYKDGDTFYVQPGDFYNYCTRPTSFTSDDHFVYKITGDSGIINWDGQNDFAISTDATPGSQAVLEIYSEADTTKPITKLNICVVGERADGYTSADSESYEWTFDENHNPTTVKGNINLSPAKGFTGKTTLEMSRDLMLDSDGYWSIEWKSNGVGNSSMIASSSSAYSQEYDKDRQPNFMYIMHETSTGWRTRRNTGYTDYFWRAYTGKAITGEHVFKMECRDNVYTFSIDGVVYDAREITEGFGAWSKNPDPNNAAVKAADVGKFDNVFNIHYLLGGISQTGISGTKYGYDGKVEYVKIKIGGENPEITRVNNYPYDVTSGSGTAKDPYIINANVAAGTVIDESGFRITAPTGTVTLSAERFGGKALTSITCDAGTKSVYAMLLGSIPSMSTFYKVNFTVSDNPDQMFFEVMADPSVASLADGTKKVYTIGGVGVEFTKGKDLFDNVTDAATMLADGDDAVLYLAAGTISGDVELDRSITVKGAQAGVNPVVKGEQKTDLWTNARADLSKESVITGTWTIKDGCTEFNLDGVTLKGNAVIKDSRVTNNVAATFNLSNIVATDLNNNQALSFGEAVAEQVGAIKGDLFVTNFYAHTMKKAALFNTALDAVTFTNCYFDGSAAVDTYRVPGVTDGSTDNTASYKVVDSMLANGQKANIFRFYLAPSNDNKNIDAYSKVDISFENNVFVNIIHDGANLKGGAINVNADTDVFSFNFKNNYVYEGDDSYASADTALIYGAGNSIKAATAADYAAAYSISGNRFIAKDKGKAPAIFSSTEDTKGHSNINVGGNYSEEGGVAAAPTTNEKTNSATGKPISSGKFYYLDPDFTQTTCNHKTTRTDRKEPTCMAEGYENVVCTDCDVVVEEKILPKGDHAYGEWIIEKYATCAEEGLRSKTCTVCQTEKITEVIVSTGHNDGKWRVEKDATCSENGVRIKYCTACMTALAQENIPMIEHTYNIKETHDSTCEGYGDNLLECITCKYSTRETIPLKLHTPGTWQVSKVASCEIDGERVICCTECSKVMQTEVVPAAHKYEWVVTEPAGELTFGKEAYKCTVCGDETDHRVVSPIYKDATDKFYDIGANDWYVKNGAIDFVYTTGLFAGTGEHTFSPNASMSRAMLVTVLGRLSGVEVNHKVTTRFVDVQKDTWYTGYVAWAADNGIVSGMTEFTFAPDEAINREQICKILESYCKFEKNFELKATEKYQRFADEDSISSWAKSAVKACQMADVVNGKDGGKFDPHGKATRAEVATIMMKLFEAQA